MKISNKQLAEMLRNDRFPLSLKYDPGWVVENQMGPNALWLTEWLSEKMNLRSGMRVLDMGCGKALSSVFLAREFGVQVWATDLWIKPAENWERIREAGMEGSVFPVYAEARALPYAKDFFDAIVCVDSYIYYGTDDLYLDYSLKFLKPGGQIGVVIPGFMRELEGPLPEHLKPFWAQECWSWHTPEWWRQHWARTDLVDIERVDTMRDGCQTWLQWDQAIVAAGKNHFPSDAKVLEEDAGRFIGLVRMVARRKEEGLSPTH